jgi:MarR family
MRPHDLSDTDIDGWLHALSITSLDQWDVLVFLYRHQATLLGVCMLAQCLGHTQPAVLAALHGLEVRGLVQRSWVSHRVRLYQVIVPVALPRREAWTHLLALASDRVGRVRLAICLRGSDPTAKSDLRQM